jgi:hypothetical protein
MLLLDTVSPSKSSTRLTLSSVALTSAMERRLGPLNEKDDSRAAKRSAEGLQYEVALLSIRG